MGQTTCLRRDGRCHSCVDHPISASRQQGRIGTVQIKGTNVEGSLSDSQLALQLVQEDMERHSTILKDRKMVASMTQAVQTDARLLEASIAQEQAELNNRREACRLGGVAPPPLTIEPAPTEADVDDRLLDVMVSKILPHSLANNSKLVSSCSRHIVKCRTSRPFNN